MKRRGFFSTLFSSSSMPEKVFFGYQLVMLEPIDGNFRRGIRQLIENRSSDDSPRAKFDFYNTIADALRENFFAAEYGFWDMEEGDRAIETFGEWVDEISEAIDADPDEMAEVPESGFEEPDIDRISCEKNYIAVTALFLLERSSSNTKLYQMLASLGEESATDKYSFERLLDVFALIDFAHVAGDAVFVLPGNDEDGLSWEDIHGEGWEYLKPIL